MNDIDEPTQNNSFGGEKPSGHDEDIIKHKIFRLAKEQLFGILCTQNEKQPYGSMIGFAFSEDLKYAVFATPKATRKYHNLTCCNNVALVVNNREKHPDELMKIEAFTATGKSEEINDDESKAHWSKILLEKQAYLKNFLDSSTTALFRIRIIRFFYVSSFQEVREWGPE